MENEDKHHHSCLCSRCRIYLPCPDAQGPALGHPLFSSQNPSESSGHGTLVVLQFELILELLLRSHSLLDCNRFVGGHNNQLLDVFVALITTHATAHFSLPGVADR